jgi:demethylmenaquinone methyltransferase/2-methoxy-6-polyprenyl-1,4-benzoquinol methylase
MHSNSGSERIDHKEQMQAVSGGQQNALPPHPAIATSYEELGEKQRFVDMLFDATAGDYDRVERWLSLGSGQRYRFQALKRAGLLPGMQAVDIGIGTGLVASGIKSLVGQEGSVVGVDPSTEMRRRAHEQFGIEVCGGTAESIPFDDAAFQFLSMGYALRHISDLNVAFSEFYRVLQPGDARLCILELTRPRTRIGRTLLRSYLGVCVRVMRLFCRMGPRTSELWRYYWETIDACIPPDQVLDALTRAGFVDVKRNVVGGIFSEYTASRGESTTSAQSEKTAQ